MIPDSVIPEGGARSLVMSDVRRIAEGLDALMEKGGLGEDDLARMRADFTNVPQPPRRCRGRSWDPTFPSKCSTPPKPIAPSRRPAPC
ncbi:phosphate ABC transporter permease family protein [uncultured Roseibium sp.]|uniref:phosphate ABC transporter permease family protein n=1 Tax=uncultured Roseibium sp. TaxID=1936171 RepID=UPI003216CEA9